MSKCFRTQEHIDRLLGRNVIEMLARAMVPVAPDILSKESRRLHISSLRR